MPPPARAAEKTPPCSSRGAGARASLARGHRQRTVIRREAVILKCRHHAAPQIGQRDRLRVRRRARAGIQEVADAVVPAVLDRDEYDFALEFIKYFFIDGNS